MLNHRVAWQVGQEPLLQESPPDGPTQQGGCRVNKNGQGEGFDLRVIRTTVLESTVETLRSAILVGHFKPGERLVEADLCATIGISRASLREALRRLEAERLIDIIPNRGPIIPVMSWAEALQIFHVRKLLEAEAAALAARNGDGTHHLRARAALADFEAAIGNGASGKAELGHLISATGDFYDAVMEAGGNRIVRELLRGLNARISFLRGRSMSMNDRAASSLREMSAMLSAIEARDEAAARDTTIAHIDAACAAAEYAYGRLNDADHA